MRLPTAAVARVARLYRSAVSEYAPATGAAAAPAAQANSPVVAAGQPLAESSGSQLLAVPKRHEFQLLTEKQLAAGPESDPGSKRMDLGVEPTSGRLP